MKRRFLLTASLLSLCFSAQATIQQQTSLQEQASRIGSRLLSKAASASVKVGNRMLKNKATYAFFGTHLVAAGVLMRAQMDSSTKGAVTVATLVAHYLLLGRHLKDSYLQGSRFENEAVSFGQQKILNTSNWLEKNGIIIDGAVYKSGFGLWKGYEAASDKKQFLRQFLSVIAVDSTVHKTRQVIAAALETIQERLAQCSDQNHERYTNAGLFLGRFFHPQIHANEPLPHNVASWLWQEERGGDLFKKPFGEAYFEEYLNEGFLTSLGVYETDVLARLFSLTETQKTIGGFTFPWYRLSSWSRNGAAHYYVALLKQYVFLLSCRALCDQIVASQIIDQKQDVHW